MPLLTTKNAKNNSDAIPIQLLVGLGNPGQEFTATRHNAGAWWIEKLASDLNVTLRTETKFHGKVARITVSNHDSFLLLPDTFMNLSGQSVRAITQFYRIPPQAILIVHDELDFSAGVIRLKKGGGHGGHNGLRDIIQRLNSHDFYRLRLGIGHPGHRSQVHDYVLSPPSKHDYTLITDAIEQSMIILSELLQGNIEKAMQLLHTKNIADYDSTINCR